MDRYITKIGNPTEILWVFEIGDEALFWEKTDLDLPSINAFMLSYCFGGLERYMIINDKPVPPDGTGEEFEYEDSKVYAAVIDTFIQCRIYKFIGIEDHYAYWKIKGHDVAVIEVPHGTDIVQHVVDLYL